MEISERDGEGAHPSSSDSYICTNGSAQCNNNLLLVTADLLCSSCIKNRYKMGQKEQNGSLIFLLLN